MNENPIPRRTVLTRFLMFVGIAVPASFLGGKLFAQQQLPPAAPPQPCPSGWNPTGPSTVQNPSTGVDNHLGQNKAGATPAPATEVIHDLGPNKPGVIAPQRKK